MANGKIEQLKLKPTTIVTQCEIGVKIMVPGFHYWKDAPDEVAFLRQSHRHLFGIECVWRVTHDDRQLEFFLMQRAIRKHLRLIYEGTPHGFIFGPLSCEAIATELVETFGLVSCTVDEDGENWGKAYGKVI